MSRLSKISIPIFLHHFLITSIGFILIKTPQQFDIWLQSYEECANAKNNIKTKIFEHCFCQYLKNDMADIQLIPLDHHVTYYEIHL